MVRERGMKCQECLKAYVTEERRLMEGAKEDMNRFSVMVDCIKPAGDTEQISLTFTKDINSHPKPVYYENYYQKAPPEGVFGLSLTEYVRKYRHPIPLVIVKCSEAIDRVGLRREGIYRVSGRHAQIMNLKKQFEANENAVDLTDAVSEDCASIAAVLKIYLRELPEPLFPFPLNERIGYSGNHSRLQKQNVIFKTIICHPTIADYQLISYHNEKNEHVEDNKMTLDNLCLIFTPAIFHDFNSAMVPGPQAAGGINQQPGDLSLTSLSFAPATTAGSPGTQTAPWSGYPSDQQNLQQQTQSYHPPPQYSPHGSSPSSPKAISDAPPGYPPVTGTHNGGTSDNKNKGSATGGATAVSQPQPSAAGTITSPLLSTAQPAQTTQISAATSNSTTTATTTPSFQPPTNTVSTAASWSNDMVLSDLIINSDTIFNVLPKLPSRTNSGMSSLSLEDQQRLSVATSASTYSLPRPYDGSRKLSSANLDRNTNLASPTEGGGGGAGRQLMPRLDSLAASTTTSHPRTSPLPSPNTMEHSSYPYQPPPPPPPQHQYQQQQQQSYHPPPHMPPQYHQNNDGWQGNTGRTNSPPSPSSLKADQMAAVGPTRSRSNQDLQQSSQQQQQQ
ncbi:hypothetical protein BX616_004448 [Lobosporangium transversale]|nr:hypothetical protein BX616_004448 [Lobosporangium transversale]